MKFFTAAVSILLFSLNASSQITYDQFLSTEKNPGKLMSWYTKSLDSISYNLSCDTLVFLKDIDKCKKDTSRLDMLEFSIWKPDTSVTICNLGIDCFEQYCTTPHIKVRIMDEGNSIVFFRKEELLYKFQVLEFIPKSKDSEFDKLILIKDCL